MEPWELGFAWSRGLPVWVGGDGVRTDAWVEEGRSPEVGRKAGKVDVNTDRVANPRDFDGDGRRVGVWPRSQGFACELRCDRGRFSLGRAGAVDWTMDY